MSTNKKSRAQAAREPKSKSGSSAYASSARVLPMLALSWVGLLLVTAIASLCPRFTAFYAIYIAVTLGLASGSLLFLKAIYRDGKAALHSAFKKFLGYGLVLHYAAAALPRVDWAGDGLIGRGRVVYLFALAMLCLVAGIVLFVAMGRPAAYAGLGLIADEEVRDKGLRKKRFAENRKKGLVHGAFEWVDALGFAAILVILIQTFVFQLYEIPSESMVPAFLMKDRPFTTKIDAAPRIPLTDWRLPWLKLPKRGDIITMANPRYPENQSVNLKKYLSQFVSMITFTAVNIDKYLPDGSVKADPLVKRVVGVPGEKLMMVDDVLYAKRKTDAAFAPVEADKTWARVDLWMESPDKRSRIEALPMDAKHRDILNAWDDRKRSADTASLAASIAASAKTIKASKVAASQAAAYLAEFKRSSALIESMMRKVAGNASELEKKDPTSVELMKAKDDYERLAMAKAHFESLAADVEALAASEPSADAYTHSGTKADDLALALCTPASVSLRKALDEYAACPEAAQAASDGYVRGGRALNLLIKDNLLGRVAREVQIIAGGGSYERLANAAGFVLLAKNGSLAMGKGDDPVLVALIRDGGELDYYVNGAYAGLYDERNFPAFPSGDAYLGGDQYFAMGDNRYNSLDFRYRTGNFAIKPLDPADPASVQYYSNIDPFALDLRFIEGYALFRVWPVSRLGAIQ